jgi:hypothetical protein
MISSWKGCFQLLVDVLKVLWGHSYPFGLIRMYGGTPGTICSYTHMAPTLGIFLQQIVRGSAVFMILSWKACFQLFVDVLRIVRGHSYPFGLIRVCGWTPGSMC